MGRDIDELMRKFKANLYLAKKTAEGCPSKWKEEGDPALAPSPEMVGRVHEALRKYPALPLTGRQGAGRQETGPLLAMSPGAGENTD